MSPIPMSSLGSHVAAWHCPQCGRQFVSSTAVENARARAARCCDTQLTIPSPGLSDGPRPIVTVWRAWSIYGNPTAPTEDQ